MARFKLTISDDDKVLNTFCIDGYDFQRPEPYFGLIGMQVANSVPPSLWKEVKDQPRDEFGDDLG